MMLAIVLLILIMRVRDPAGTLGLVHSQYAMAIRLLTRQ